MKALTAILFFTTMASVANGWDINFEENQNIQSGGELPVNGDWKRIGYNGYHTTIKEGDIIDLRVELQVTNDAGYNIGYTCYLAYILDAHSYDRTDWTYIKGTRTGQNVSPQQHHDRVAKTGIYEHVGADVADAWFGVWCRSYSTAGHAGDVVDVDRMGVFMLHFKQP